MTIHTIVHMIAGMPVALAMFTASVGTAGANGDERKKTFFRSSKAFKMHCIARKLTMKVAMRGLPNRATRNKAPAKTMPAKSVNGIPGSEPHDPATIGLKSPKTVVNRSINAAEPKHKTRRDGA